MKSVKSINRLYLAVVVFYIAASYGISYLTHFIHLPNNFMLMLSQMLICTPVLIYLIATKTNPFQSIQKKKLKFGTVLLLILFAYSLIPIIAVINAISMIFAENEVTGMLQQISGNPFIVNLILLAVIPSIFEEFVFRGVFYHTYRKKGLWAGIWISGGLFGLMHLNFNQFSYAFVMGVVLALLIEATGSIFSAMIVHFVINGNSVILSLFTKELSSSISVPPTDSINAIDSAMSPGLENLSLMIGIIFIFIVVIGAGAICVGLYLGIAKLSGRYNYLRYLFFSKKKTSIEETPDKIWDIYLILGILVSFAFMFLSEFA